mgnify:CR=1 FL=1|jgi:phage minor structural protein, N-terminal region
MSIEVWDTVERLAFLPAASSVKVREVLNGEYYVSFNYSKRMGDEEKYDALQLGNEIRFPDEVENGQRFIIREADDSDSSSKPSKYVEAHHIFFETGRLFYDDYIDFMTGQTPEDMLQRLFAGTAVSYTVSGTFSPMDIFDWGEKSRLALLHELREIFEAELQYDNLTLTFTKRKGEESGAEIRYRKNRKNISRKVNDMDRVTRLYGYGQDGLTIEGYNGHIKKYIDSSYYSSIRPFEAKMEWNDIDNQAELFSAMEKYLAENELPRVTYEVGTLRIAGVNVGDSLRIVDDPLGFDVVARLYEHDRYPYDKKQRPRMILGNFRERTISDYMLTYRRKVKEAQAYYERRSAELAQEQQELQVAQDELEEYLDGVFMDGVITAAEAKAIGEHKLVLANEKADVDAEYGKLYSSLYLTNTTLKAALAAAKTAYDDSYTALISAIDTAAADSNVTPVERTAVDAGFADLKAKLSVLRQALQDTWTSITQTGLDAIAGKGIHSGGTIRLENRTFTKVQALLTAAVSAGATTIPVQSTTGFPSSGSAYINDKTAPQPLFHEPIQFSYTGKTATSFTGVTGVGYSILSSGSVYLWTRPSADVVVAPMEVVMPDGQYKQIPETRFSNQQLGTNVGDIDGWEFRLLYLDNNGVVKYESQGTSAGGVKAYPTTPAAAAVRIGYLFVGYGIQDPDLMLQDGKHYDDNGYPLFKEIIYHDNRFRDERAVRANGSSEVALGGSPYGAQVLAVSVAAKTYQTYYIPVGAGRRSVNLSITIDDGTDYDNYTYGAQLTVGRKAANNADGLGRSVWSTYVDADGQKGHVTGQRNLSPYGPHILSPRVWNKSYTCLYDADLIPSPDDASVIALKLTFYNYHASVTESFNLKLNWHAL